jgi:hypothetical protein
MVVWWGALVECHSALARQLRDESLDEAGYQAASLRLRRLCEAWIEVPPVDEVRSRATRVLRLHPLRAADALHLAAALVAAGSAPDEFEFVTFDDRQGRAAALEGFRVVS